MLPGLRVRLAKSVSTARLLAAPPVARSVAGPLALCIASLLSCSQPGARNAGQADPVAVAAPAATTAAKSGAAAVARQESPAQPFAVRTVATLPWGAGPAAVGRVVGGDQNPEGPMALDADAQGRLWLLDQVNSRALQLAGGTVVRSVAVSRTAHDVLARGDRLWLLDRLVERNVQSVTVADGRLRETLSLQSAALRQAGLDEPGVLSSLLAADGGVWAEIAHGTVVQLAALDGTHRPSIVRDGRPTASGDATLKALRVPPHQAAVTRWTTGQAAPSASLQAQFGKPLREIHELASDAQGRTWLVADLDGVGAAVDRGAGGERWAVIWSAAGRELARVSLCASVGPHESLRPVRLGADGHLYNACSGPQGVQVQEVVP